jgi:hypothetical protein
MRPRRTARRAPVVRRSETVSSGVVGNRRVVLVARCLICPTHRPDAFLRNDDVNVEALLGGDFVHLCSFKDSGNQLCENDVPHGKADRGRRRPSLSCTNQLVLAATSRERATFAAIGRLRRHTGIIGKSRRDRSSNSARPRL